MVVASLLSFAALVTALPLPPGFTIQPEGQQRLMAVNARGTIVATISQSKEGASKVVRWRPDGRRDVFRPLAGRGDFAAVPASTASASALRADDIAYVDIARVFGGAYSGVATETQRWNGASISHYDPDCGAARGDQHAAAIDARGRIAMTFDAEGVGSMRVDRDDISVVAPYAVVIDDRSCTLLGRAIVRALRGTYAAGYRVYLGNRPAPTILNRFAQTYRTVRWQGRIERELGPGVGLAVSAHGIVAGASAVPAFTGTATGGYADAMGVVHTYSDAAAVPSARVWDAAGRARDIAPDADRSVAYDVADDGTVVGMLQARDGKHYAFLWRNGALRRLDDLVHPAGWRFECAYAIAPSGAIVGIGTFRGIATAFVLAMAPGRPRR
jgi:probable HAF family extracellular repeat protein